MKINKLIKMIGLNILVSETPQLKRPIISFLIERLPIRLEIAKEKIKLLHLRKLLANTNNKYKEYL